jgi:hypothetical protein
MKIPIVLIAIIWVFVFILKEDFDIVFWVFTTVSFSLLFLSVAFRKYVKIFFIIELFFWLLYFIFFQNYLLDYNPKLLSPSLEFNKELLYVALVGALARIFNLAYFIFRWSWKLTCAVLIASCIALFFITFFL